MAILSLQAKDALARIGPFDALNCLSSLQWDGALNSEMLSQLGDANYDAQMTTPEVSGSMEARSTGSLAALLSRMIYNINTGTGEFTGYMAGVTGAGVNTQLILETDLERAVFDLIEAKRANEAFDRSTLIPRAHLSSFSISASTDGTASESYSFEADVLEIYRKPLHDLIVIPATRKTGSLTTTVEIPAAYTVEGTGVVAAADWKIVALDLNGVRVPPSMLTVTNGVTKGTNPDAIALTAAAQTAGYSIPQGEKLGLIVYKKTPGQFPTITYPTTARFVKADQIDIWLVDPAATFLTGGQTSTVAAHIAAGRDINAIPFTQTDLLLRTQSASINVDLRREALRQIRKTDNGSSVFARSATYPINVGIQVSLLESELAEWAKLQGKNAYGSATPDILDLNSFENKQWVVAMRYYKAGAALQTVICSNARVEGVGASISSGGRAERSYNLTGSALAIKGASI